jgi:hypothetical protein
MHEDPDIATSYVVARALNILLDHGFAGQDLIQETVYTKRHMVNQQRMELSFPTSAEGLTCSVRWFILPERENYQYLNKIKAKVLDISQVPEVVRAAAARLSEANTCPGSLRFTEANVSTDYEGPRFIRMEQSYSADEGSKAYASLILRVEFSWNEPPVK